MDTEDLYYYRARYYDPHTQRFLSSDPIEFEAGDFNFYRYVGGDPVNLVDPSGLDPRLNGRGVPAAMGGDANKPIDCNCSIIESATKKLKDKYKDLTAWHFEGQEALNKKVSYQEVIKKDSGWTKLSEAESVFHDNGIGKPELKFIHPNGSEVVFDGDTLNPVTDPKYMPTYNYCNPKPFKEVNDTSSFIDWAWRGIKHGVSDVLPYIIGGNVRGEN